MCFVEMERGGLCCTREAFNFVMSAHANSRNLEEARSWLDKAEKAGFVAKVGEYTLLLHACAPSQDRPANPDEARLIFLHQVADGIEPNHANLQALANALGKTACDHLLE